MLKGNKGEWSEIYTLFKLLSEKKLFAGDPNLNKIESLFYPIVTILRQELTGKSDYRIEGEIVIISQEARELKIPISTFSENAILLLEAIKKSTSTFHVPEVEELIETLRISSLKANSTTKSDIQIVIYDQQINQSAELGFSIKSKLGGDSTLLNAGKTTNFIYEVKGFKGSDKDVERINLIDSNSKIKDRLEEIKKLGGELSFVDLQKDVFKNNLVLIDSLLPNILGQLVLDFFTSARSKVKDLTESISSSNPLNFDQQHSHAFYDYKIKKFLTDVALGMMPAKVWNGKYEATGGYLIVKEDGEVLCYHIYNRNQFEDYLFSNTKLETASSTRHEFGSLYFENGRLFCNLNLQIRFI